MSLRLDECELHACTYLVVIVTAYGYAPFRLMSGRCVKVPVDCKTQ